MTWLCIDATDPERIVICFAHGLDVHVFPHVAELVERATGRLLAIWLVPRA